MTRLKKKIHIPNPAVTVRRRQVDSPERLSRVIDLYQRMCQELGTGRWWTFAAPGRPTSMNALWNITAGGNGYKAKATRSFEDALLLEARRTRVDVRGTAAIIIAVESKHWLKQDNTVREMDVDNFMKSPIDAIKTTMGGDHVLWEDMIFKVQSKRERTTVWLFEFGDIVEAYAGPCEPDPSSVP